MLMHTGGQITDEAKPLTTEELMAGGWWCADISEDCRLAFESKGIRAWYESWLRDGYHGHCYLDGDKIMRSFQPGSELLQIHRVGNQFFWSEKKMTFEQFQTNVQQWSEARGIYAHSTALAQALKAVSEVGELADATIKGNIDELRDAIGDVAVCLVNVAHMTESQLDHDYIFDDAVHDRTAQEGAAGVAGSVGELSFELSGRNNNGAIAAYIDAGFHLLYVTAKANNLDFLDCCEAAWNEIKDRKGHMVAGGAFVKDE